MNDQDFITITNHDIWEKLAGMEELQRKTLEQALKTNGRVTSLESKSIGVWISKHPLRFTASVLVFISVFIPNIRDPLLALIKNFLIV